MSDLRLVRPTTLLIPSLSVFREIPINDYYDRFAGKQDIKQIAIPLIESQGFFFPYTIGGERRPGRSFVERDSATGAQQNLIDICEFVASKGHEIIFHVEPSMTELSLVSGACDLVDQSGSRSARCCLNNPTTPMYIRLLSENLASALSDRALNAIRGVALHIVDIWPMSAHSGRFLITCFCPSCIADLTAEEKQLDPDWFRMFPNCVNLGLSESIFQDEDGEDLGSIGSVRNLRRGMSADQLLQVCTRLRGTAAARAFDAGNFDSQRGNLTRWARQLLLYLGARASLTIGAVAEVLRTLRDEFPQARRILVVPDDPYDWSMGIFSDELSSSLSDEVWAPISSQTFGTGIVRRPLLARRSCYYINNFLSTLHSCSNKQLRIQFYQHMTTHSIKKRLRRLADQALSELPSGGDPILPQEITRDDGIVVGLNEEIIDALVASAMAEIDEGSILL